MKVVPLRLQPDADLRRALEAWMGEARYRPMGAGNCSAWGVHRRGSASGAKSAEPPHQHHRTARRAPP